MWSQQYEHIEQVSETYFNVSVCYKLVLFDQFVYGCIILPVALLEEESCVFAGQLA